MVLSKSNAQLGANLPLFLGRGKVFNNILETVGCTPLVRLNALPAEKLCHGEVVAKLEFFNPLSSVKDRIGVAMIESSELDGTIGPGTVVYEATSGNTGIGLAFTCAVKGYELVLVMPESVSAERISTLKYLGAKVILTDVELGVRGAIDEAQRLAKEDPKGWMVNQDYHPANFETHRTRTASEIWNDAGGKVDALVAGVGTSGTLSGVASALREWNPELHVAAVQPDASPVLTEGDEAAAPHGITGIGAFVPDFYDENLVDEVFSIEKDEAIETAREAARKEGMPVGISGGAALAAALRLAQRPIMRGKRIVAIVPSSAERYQSTELFAHTREEQE